MPTLEQIFWVWRNAWFAQRKSKARWAYDLVKSGRESEEKTLELLEDLVAQSENDFKFEAMFISQAHGHTETSEACRSYGSPCGFMSHLSGCEGCRALWKTRFEANKDKYSDKQPY